MTTRRSTSRPPPAEAHELSSLPQLAGSPTTLVNDPEHQLEYQRIVGANVHSDPNSSSSFSSLPNGILPNGILPNGILPNGILPNNSPPRRDTSYLDGLRGLASLFVFIQHYIGTFTLNIHEHGFGQGGKHYYIASLPFLRVLFNGGQAAVTIFFVLSGYVLSVGPLSKLRRGQQHQAGKGLVSAAVRRPVRLYLPPLTVSLIVALLLHVPGPLVEPLPWTKRKASVAAEVVNWARESTEFFNPFQGMREGWYSYNMPAWTMPLELQGSTLVFFLLLLHAYNGLGRVVTLFLLFFGASTLLHFGQWAMANFILGLILAFVDTWRLDEIWLTHRWRSARVKTLVYHILFFGGWFLASTPAHAGNIAYARDTPGYIWLTRLLPAAYQDPKRYFRYWASWGSFLLVFGTLRIRWVQSFLCTRPLRFLGRVSFMLYLVHLPLFRIFGERFRRAVGVGISEDESLRGWWDGRLYVPDMGPVGMSSRFVLCVAVVLPLALGVAEAGTRWVDEPSVRLARRVVVLMGLERGKGGGLPR